MDDKVRRVYHIYNRGSRRARIFVTARDYRFFWNMLDKWLPNFNMKLMACTLMPNHIHLEPSPVTEATLSGFMHRIGTIYGMHFTYVNAQCGHVFQSTYRRKIIQSRFGVVNLFRYISQNPVELCSSKDWNSKLDHMRKYEWGTYKYYCGCDKKIPVWLDRDKLLSEFGGNYRSFVEFSEHPIKKWERALLDKELGS